MRINRKLNYVIPVYDDPIKVMVKDEVTGLEKEELKERVRCYVHSTPISQEIFETYFMELSQAFATIFGGGLGPVAGPRVARLILKKVAENLGTWEGEAGVQQGLFAEIARLSNVIVSTPSGWQTVPYDEAIKQGLLDAEEKSEVENALTFFIVVSAMHKKDVLLMVLSEAGKLWSAQITSSNSTEFLASLPTSKQDGSTGGTAPALSIPH